MSTHENPLLDLGYDIPFDRIRAEHVEPAIEALIERVKAQLTEIGDATDTPTYAGTLEALEVGVDNISAGGVKLQGASARAAGERVELLMDAGQGRVVILPARVAWMGGTALGLMFAGAARWR